MRFLLDTNVISEARKVHADANLRSWMESVPDGDLFLSVLVLGEIRQGVERLRRRDAAQAALYDRWLATLRRDYAERLLPVTDEIAHEWGRLNVPDPLSVIDGLLAATAMVHAMTFVTRDDSEVGRTGALVLNPFEPH